MKQDVKNKLILALLPAVAARNTGAKFSTPDELKQFWTDCLNEASSLAELYETFITPAVKDEG